MAHFGQVWIYYAVVGGGMGTSSECASFFIQKNKEEKILEKKNTASLVLGICSLIAWFIPLLGFPVSIIGLILGIKDKYTAGIVLNVIGLALTVCNSAIGAFMGANGML